MKHKILFWTPRIICILAITFVMLFSFDVFEPKYTFGEQMLAFLMHNIPTLILIAFLVVAWKWELAGGIIFILISLFSIIRFTGFFTQNFGIIILAAPFLIAGVLFLIHYFQFKKIRDKSIL
ncbi:MAG: hypothetical protein V1904_12955 [Bacteroidota bacterium]